MRSTVSVVSIRFGLVWGLDPRLNRLCYHRFRLVRIEGVEDLEAGELLCNVRIDEDGCNKT